LKLFFELRFVPWNICLGGWLQLLFFIFIFREIGVKREEEVV